MNAADIAYSAGIFDGEGWAIIAPYNYNSTFKGTVYPRHRVRIGVSNTSLLMLEWLKCTWGGNIYLGYPRKGKRRPLYSWQSSEKIAAPFLSQILSYLKIKTGQVRLDLKFRSTIGRTSRGRPVSKSILDERNRLMNAMRVANDPLGRFHRHKRLGHIMVKVAKGK